MTFIRTKIINGKEYAYLVETQKTNKGPRQRVKQYLGSIIKVKGNLEQNNSIVGNGRKDFLLKFLEKTINKQELKRLNIIQKKLSFFKKNNKEVVLKTNEGHLCSFTLNRILNFRKTNNLQNDGYKLAKYFLQAGLNVTKEEFIEFYTKK
tara:strand:+ start:672 stop:1121 length:450 start_codon:yes stop_codon:yes gene_type:complete